MERKQDASVFVFDEPTIGSHSLDVQILLQVFDRLVSSNNHCNRAWSGRNPQCRLYYWYGSWRGEAGGRIIARGTPEKITCDRESITEKLFSSYYISLLFDQSVVVKIKKRFNQFTTSLSFRVIICYQIFLSLYLPLSEFINIVGKVSLLKQRRIKCHTHFNHWKTRKN